MKEMPNFTGVSAMPRLRQPLERLGGDLRHLGEQPLTHLGAAVVQVNGAIVVNVHERAGLVEEGEREGDAELHRRERDAALEGAAGPVPGANFLASAIVVGGLAQLRHQFIDDAILLRE